MFSLFVLNVLACGVEEKDTAVSEPSDDISAVDTEDTDTTNPDDTDTTDPDPDSGEQEAPSLVGSWTGTAIQGAAFPYTESNADGSLTFNGVVMDVLDDLNGTIAFDTEVSDASGAVTFPFPVDGTVVATLDEGGTYSVNVEINDETNSGLCEPFSISCTVTEQESVCVSESDDDGNALDLTFQRQ